MQNRLRHSGLGLGSALTITSLRSSWTPQSPTSLVATVINGERVDLECTLNGTGEAGVSWEYSADGSTFTEHGTSQAGDNTYSATLLTPYTPYFFRCRVFKGAVFSGYSNIVVVLTSYPSALDDGNTVAWHDALVASTLTMNASKQVSQQDDLTANNNDLVQTSADAAKPTFPDPNEGLLYNGSAQSMKKAFAFTQPEFIYAVIKQVTWTLNDVLWDGNSSTERGYLRQTGNTPELSVYAGTASANNGNLPVDTWGIVKICFNGANSWFQIDDTAAISGNYGSHNMNGINTGASYVPNGWGNLREKIRIMRHNANVADEATKTPIIDAYLKARQLNPAGHLRLADMPVGLNQHGFETCNGKLYVVGGAAATGNVKTCYEYDPDTNVWTQKADAPIEVQSPVLRCVGTKLYLIGGLLLGSLTSTGRCFEFDPATNIWTEKTAMPTAREDFGSAVLGTKIYCFGGLNNGPDPIATLEIYDTVNNTWDESKADMPNTKWSGDFGVECGGYIYAMSSCRNFAGYPTVTTELFCYKYDPIADSWSSVTTPDTGIAYKECVAIGTDIYMGPGQINGDYRLANTKTNAIWKFNTVTPGWTRVLNAPYMACGISMTVLNNKIYLSGGDDRAGNVANYRPDFYRLGTV